MKKHSGDNEPIQFEDEPNPLLQKEEESDDDEEEKKEEEKKQTEQPQYRRMNYPIAERAKLPQL